MGAFAAFLFVALAGPSAGARPLSTPNGPWVTNTQNVSLAAFSDDQQLTRRLIGIERASNGTLTLEVAGVSGGGRPIWLARIGDPRNTPVLIITQQHGDEPHGTEAALDLIQSLSTGSANARRILDHLLVLVIPRVNPDGAELPTRGNADFSAPPNASARCPAAGGTSEIGRGIFTTRYLSSSAFSYDINRYHWSDWTQSWQFLCNVDSSGDPVFPENPVPEAVAVVDTYLDYGPIWTVDVHNQQFNVVDPDRCDPDQACRPGRYVTGSVLWPTHPDVAPEAVDLSKQMAIVMKQRSVEIGNVELTRYQGSSFEAIARNAYALLGSDRLAMGERGPLGGSLLYEVAGQTEGLPFINNGQKASGKLRSGIVKLVTALLAATADGSLFDLDPDAAETLILDNDTLLPNPRFFLEE